MRSARAAPLFAVLFPILLGADSGTLISRETAPVPERVRGPLPARLDLAMLSTTEALRSLGLARLPQFRQLLQRVCRGDAAERMRFGAGLKRALAEPDAPLRTAYYEVATNCRDVPDHCEWLASEADRASGATATFLWSATALCWPLNEAGRFEGDDVPDDAVVAFHAKRQRVDRVHSARLAAIVDRRVRSSDAAAARDALEAYASMDHPATTEHLLRLHSAATDDELRYALAAAMGNQSDPKASQLFKDACARRLDAEIKAWNEGGAQPRASPLRWGGPCKSFPALSRRDAHPDDVREDPLDAIPDALGRRAWLMGKSDFQFGDHSGLLRELVELLRPELDDAYFDDVWPAANAVHLFRGPRRTQTFVGGDAMIVGVPQKEGAPDLSVAEAIGNELTAALLAPRVLEVWWRGEQFRFVHHGSGDEYDVDAALAIANFLLEEAGSTRRAVRLAVNRGLGVAVLIAEPDGMASARRQNLLVKAVESSPPRPTEIPRDEK